MTPRDIRKTLLALLIVLIGVTACTPANVPPEEAIVGQWVNAQGGTIYFYADGTGFIPAVQGEVENIPSAAFKYYFNDDNHLGIVMGEQQAMVIEIKLERNKLTWRSPGTGREFLYTRRK